MGPTGCAGGGVGPFHPLWREGDIPSTPRKNRKGWGSHPHPGWVGVDPHCPTVPSLQKNHLTFGHVASLRCTTGSCVVVACCAPWIRRLLGRAAIPGSSPNRGRGWQAGPPVPRSTRSFSQVLELFFFHLALLQNLCKALWRRTIWIPPLVH